MAGAPRWQSHVGTFPSPPQARVFNGKCRPWHGRFVRSTHPSTETRCCSKATKPRPPARPGSATFFSSPPPLSIWDPLRLPCVPLGTHVHPLPAPAYSPLRTAASLAATRLAGPCSLSTFLKQPLMRQATAPAHRRPCYSPPDREKFYQVLSICSNSEPSWVTRVLRYVCKVLTSVAWL
jgi:hypothetical protein